MHLSTRLRSVAGDGDDQQVAAGSAAAVFSSDEEREVEERLRGLGYLE